jgi:hypothetical protein
MSTCRHRMTTRSQICLFCGESANPLKSRQDVILAAFQNETLSEEQADALLDELGDIEVAIQKAGE